MIFQALLSAFLGTISFLRHGAREQKIYIKNYQAPVHCLQDLLDKILALAKETNIHQSDESSNNLNFFVSNSTVLLVEDTPIIQRVHKNMLEKLGLCVELVESGE